jgi:hypothetical protein
MRCKPPSQKAQQDVGRGERGNSILAHYFKDQEKARKEVFSQNLLKM